MCMENLYISLEGSPHLIQQLYDHGHQISINNCLNLLLIPSCDVWQKPHSLLQKQASISGGVQDTGLCVGSQGSDQTVRHGCRVTCSVEVMALAAEGGNDTEALIIGVTTEKPLCERPPQMHSCISSDLWPLTPPTHQPHTSKHARMEKTKSLSSHLNLWVTVVLSNHTSLTPVPHLCCHHIQHYWNHEDNLSESDTRLTLYLVDLLFRVCEESRKVTQSITVQHNLSLFISSCHNVPHSSQRCRLQTYTPCSVFTNLSQSTKPPVTLTK